MNQQSLRQLYDIHVGKVSDKWSSYLEVYDRVLGMYRSTPVRLLEIGIQNGGSLEIWAKYFETAQTLIGCDINPDCAKLAYADPCIHVLVGDAGTSEILQRVTALSPLLDIVIDDGSHQSRDMVRNFSLYFPQLADGGVFIAEDMHSSYWSQFGGGLSHPYAGMTFYKQLADVIHAEYWGVPKDGRDLLAKTLQFHECDIDSTVLSHVHAIEFRNSMVIVTKRAPAENTLGSRVVGGQTASVWHEVVDLRGSTRESYLSHPVFDQSSNRWNTEPFDPEFPQKK
ncbi:MAG: class I SAM-dependent methyltransferase [Ramlibacter sp.]